MVFFEPFGFALNKSHINVSENKNSKDRNNAKINETSPIMLNTSIEMSSMKNEENKYLGNEQTNANK